MAVSSTGLAVTQDFYECQFQININSKSMSNQQISRASFIFIDIIGNLNKKILIGFKTKRGEEVIQKN